jgi:hypothetical protein
MEQKGLHTILNQDKYTCNWQKIDDIPNIEELQKTILGIAIKRDINKMTPLKPLFFDLINNFILSNPHPIWNNSALKNGIVFISEPESVQSLHVDGFADTLNNTSQLTNKPWVRATDIALNIPIYNCGQGTMHWYGGAKFSLIEKEVNEEKVKKNGSGQFVHNKIRRRALKSGRRSTFLKLTWEGEPVEIDHVLVDQPHLVRINIPHKTINASTDRRMMLSLRFDPELKFDII